MDNRYFSVSEIFSNRERRGRVTENKGAKTPGVDGKIWNTPAQKMKGALTLIRKGYKALPLRRVLIPKKNGKKRPLGIPTIKDRGNAGAIPVDLRADSRELLENNIIPAINSFLKTRGLKLSKEKTRIVRIEQGFDFLGQHLQKFRNKLITTPSKENSKSFLDKVRSVIKKCYGQKTCDMINQLNPIIKGWAYYHRYVQSARTFSLAAKVISDSLWRWIKRRHSNKSCQIYKDEKACLRADTHRQGSQPI